MLEASKEAPLKATNRLTPVVLLIAVLLVLSATVSNELLYIAMSLVSLVVALRGYALASLQSLARCRVSVRVGKGLSSKPLEYEVEIVNSSSIPIAFAEFSLAYSPNLRLLMGSKAGLLFIPPKGSVTYRVLFDSRIGRHEIGPLKAVVRDPLGLFRSEEVELAKAVEVEVVPVVSEARVRKLWVMTRSTGVVRAREPGTGVEIYGVREYRPGDELRRIVWRTLALAGRLSVKEMERESFQTVIFVIEASPEMFHGPYKATPFEHAASIVASIAGYLARRGDLISAIVVSPHYSESSGKPSRGRQAYIRILKTLAKTPYVLTCDQPRSLLVYRALKQLIAVLPRERNLVFLFTTPGDRGYLNALIEFSNKVRSLGNEVYVAIPLTTAYEVRGLQPWAQAVYRVKTFDLVRNQLEFAKSLAKHQVKVLALGPYHMPQAIVNIIELTRSR